MKKACRNLVEEMAGGALRIVFRRGIHPIVMLQKMAELMLGLCLQGPDTRMCSPGWSSVSKTGIKDDSYILKR
jgi:hypothetical protein